MAIKGDLAQILSGMPIPVEGCNIAITQPTIKEISAYGEDLFLSAIQVFTNMDKIVAPIKEDNPRLEMLSDFQVLMAILEKQEGRAIKDSLEILFQLIFPNYSWEFAPGSINFRLDEHQGIIGQMNPMNIGNFQNILQLLFLPQSNTDSDEPEFNPANSAAAEIAKKLQKGREHRAELRQSDDNHKVLSLFATYASSLSIGLSMDLHILYNYTPFQLYDAFKRYTLKMAYDLYMKISTTPMMDASEMEEPTNWLESMY